jgi:hypothetical protein
MDDKNLRKILTRLNCLCNLEDIASDGNLQAIIDELQALNNIVSTASNQTVILSQLQNINTNTSDNASENTLSNILTALSNALTVNVNNQITGFALESTLNLVLNKIQVTKGNTTTRNSIIATTTPINLLAANTNRTSVVLTNKGVGTLYVIYGSGGNSTDYSFELEPNETAFIDDTLDEINGVWSVVGGNVFITETSFV